MRLQELVATSEAVRRTRSRKEKIARLASCLRELAPEEIGLGVAVLAGRLPDGRIGVGGSAVRAAREAPPAAASSLEVATIGRALQEISALSGRGSRGERAGRLGALFAAATEPEQEFLARLLIGELRQGASEGLMAEALAAASGIEPQAVRRALMVAGDPGAVAEAALRAGAPALAGFEIRVFRPVQPMLAQPAEDLAQVFERMHTAAFEWKLDGARIQAHKSGDEVRVYSRRLNDVTLAVPEVVEVVAALDSREAILDGETIALHEDGRPWPFQTTMRRFGRRLDVARLRSELPLSCFFFDCLLSDGGSLVDEPYHARLERLRAIVPERLRVPHLVTSDPEAAAAFRHEALERDHEGLMAKSLEASYEAGGRGASWLKLKSAHTLDLVVLAAEWGSGRRRGWLSNLHLGARDPGTGGFVMLGKTFKGLTDEVLAWQTQRFLELETERDRHVVHVRPEVVVEIAFNDVQQSPHYPGGLALRFARVKGYRPDKRVDEVDTIETIRALLPDDGRGPAE